MDTVRFELLTPDEIIEKKSKCSIAYLPIGPLEWHGPHLAVGMDPMNAEAVSREIAKKIGGVVLPTLFFGTERERSPQMLKNIGFKGEEWVVGMDHPNNSMLSLYSPEDIFGLIVREYLRMLVKQNFRLIVIISGHGAENQLNTLERLAKEFSAETKSTVISYMALPSFIEEEPLIGHASKTETSILSFLYPECVDLNKLPSRSKKLYNLDYAIVDGKTFNNEPAEDFSVREDPRDSTIEFGEKAFNLTVSEISSSIKDTFEKLKNKL